MHVDFNQVLIIQITHAVLMVSIRHLIYASIYVSCQKLILYVNFKIISISNLSIIIIIIILYNNIIMLLATSLFRKYQNNVLYGIKVIAYMLLFWVYLITPHALHYMSILLHRGISCTDNYSSDFFPQ